MSGRAAPLAALLCAVLAAAAQGAEVESPPGGRIARLEAPLPPVSALPSPAHSLSGVLGPDLRERWRESTRRERSRDYAGAAALRKNLVAELPGDVHLYWRIARDSIRAAEELPWDATSQRRVFYEEALEWAGRGRDLDPSCGECCFYEFAARGRLVAPGGSIPSPRGVRRVARTLEECLENPPSWTEGPGESELGYLYYGAATFYRRLPGSRWFQWVAGVRGDRERAVALGRRAVALAPDRIDFQVELGASLLCLATERDDPAARDEGVRWLERTLELPERQPTDAIDRQRARAMLGDPGRACRDSRLGFLEGG